MLYLAEVGRNGHDVEMKFYSSLIPSHSRRGEGGEGGTQAFGKGERLRYSGEGPRHSGKGRDPDVWG